MRTCPNNNNLIKVCPILIPKYWAVYKQRFDKVDAKQIKRQATIKHYSWSDISQEDALRHAKHRVIEAQQRWLAGEDIHRLERKELYNTELGNPIREQILLEQSFIDLYLQNYRLILKIIILMLANECYQYRIHNNLVAISVKKGNKM